MYKKFVYCFISISAVLAFLVAGFNLVVDPYDVWKIYRNIGFNQWIVQAENQERLIKPIEVVDVQPQVVFIGASQVLGAIDATKFEQITGRSAYNFSLRGASVYEMRRSLEHISMVDDNLEEVFLGISFEEFANNRNHPLKHTGADFQEGLYGSRHMTTEVIKKTLFSMDAISDAINTIKVNQKERFDFPYYTATGMSDERSLLFCSHRDHWTFNRSLAAMLRKGDYYYDMQLNEGAFDELKKIIDLCDKQGIHLTLFTLPIHARYMEAYALSWETYSEWEHRIVKMAPFREFVSYNGISTSLEKRGVTIEQANPFFWNTLHIKRNVGDMIVDVLTGCAEQALGFGAYVTTENVDLYLQELERGRSTWEAAHPESVEEIRYYTGFSPIVPIALQGRKYAHDRLVARIDTETGAERLLTSLPRNAHLDLTGECLSLIDTSMPMYVLLERDDGIRYYSVADPAPNPYIANFMHDRRYEMSGFRIFEPLGKIEEGGYNLYLVMVNKDGIVYQSDSLAVVEIK